MKEIYYHLWGNLSFSPCRLLSLDFPNLIAVTPVTGHLLWWEFPNHGELKVSGEEWRSSDVPFKNGAVFCIENLYDPIWISLNIKWITLNIPWITLNNPTWISSWEFFVDPTGASLIWGKQIKNAFHCPFATCTEATCLRLSGPISAELRKC